MKNKRITEFLKIIIWWGYRNSYFLPIVFLFFSSASRVCVDQIYCHYLICLVMSHLSLHLRNHLAQWGCEISKLELLSCIFKLQNKLKCINGWNHINGLRSQSNGESAHISWTFEYRLKGSGTWGAWKMIKMTLIILSCVISTQYIL